MKQAITSLALALLVAGGVAGCQKSEEAPEGATPEQVANAKPYPLDVCLVSGEPLDSMGGAVAIVHEGQTIKFCCKDCISDFKDDPATFMVKLSQPAKEAKPEVPETPEVPQP